MKSVLIIGGLVMVLYLVGSIIGESKIGLAMVLAYGLFLVTKGSVSVAFGYDFFGGMYALATFVVLILGIVLPGGRK